MPTSVSQDQPRVVVRERFRDADELAELAEGWNVELRQLSSGPSHSELVQIVDGATSIARLRLDRPFDQVGASAGGVRVFAIPEIDSPPVRWCAHDTSDDSLLCFGPRGEFHGISRAGFDMYALSIPVDTLAGAANTLRLASADELLGREQRVITPPPPVLRELRERVRSVIRTAREHPRRVAMTFDPGELGDALAISIMRLLASTCGGSAGSVPRKRTRAVDRAVSFIHVNAPSGPRISEVSRAAGVTERALEYGFLASFGVTPKRYLQSLRLAGVRRELRGAGRSTSIADVANHWGYWHMGQFAADYRKQFGELPSRTIEKASCKKSASLW